MIDRVIPGSLFIVAFVAAGFALALTAAPTASAGIYDVKSCGKWEPGRSSEAFSIRRSGAGRRLLFVEEDCEPGPGDNGIVTRTLLRRGKVARGTVAYALFQPPPGMAITQMRWSGELNRYDCDWAVQLYAIVIAPNGQRARRPLSAAKCKKAPRTNRANARRASIPRARPLPAAGAVKVIQRIVCVDRTGCRTNPIRGWPRADARTFESQIKVQDLTPPRVQILPEGLVGGGWVTGKQIIRFAAADDSGIRWQRLVIGNEWDRRSGECAVHRTVPCVSPPGELGIDLTPLGGSLEGTRTATVEVSDAAGNTAAASAVARIDNTAPGRVDAMVEAGDGWRRSPGFSVRWTNPPEVDRAPIAAARYRIRRMGARAWSTEPRTIVAPGIDRIPQIDVEPGEWELTLWRRDAAGNENEQLASVPVRLRYDPNPPEVAFDPVNASDPTRLTALARDSLSGVASGGIEISREGGGTWQSLPTTNDGTHLVARVDDTQFPSGTYVLRARVIDKAGNETTTDRRLDGSAMVLTLPLRTRATLTGGTVGSRLVRKPLRRKGRRRTVRRRMTVLRSKATVRYGRKATLAGRLVNVGGQPIAGASVQILEVTPFGTQPIGVATTDTSGTYRFITTGIRNRTLRIAYAGTAHILPASVDVEHVVPAATSFHVTRRIVRIGQQVTFGGRVASRPLPFGGKIVETQYWDPRARRWTTFGTVRANAEGRWRSPYRFGTACRGSVFKLRARVPAEIGYPFATGTSRVLRVRGKGRCR